MALPITLRSDPLPGLAPTLPDQSFVQNYANLDPSGSSQLRRGWVSAGEGIDANELFAKANEAARMGDLRSAQTLEMQARDQIARAQTWAPTTQKFTDINSAGTASDWLMGNVGNLRTSVAPMVGGVLGRVAGGTLGGIVAGRGAAAVGAELGALGGAFVPGYNMEYGEAMGQAMLDPKIRTTRTPEEMHHASQVKGAIAGGLEALVPASLSKLPVKGMAGKTLGRTILKEGAEEFATEGLQNLTGQATQNYLRDDPLTQFDYKEAFNDAMAGAAGGGAMATGMGALGKVRDTLGAGVSKATDVVRDPTGAAVDYIKQRGEKRGINKAREEIDAASETPEQTLERIRGKPSITDPMRDHERDMDASSLDKARHEEAMREAQEIVNAPAGMYRRSTVEAAASFLAGQADWTKLRNTMKADKADQKSEDDVNELLRAAGLEDSESRNSLMRPTLTDDHGEQEGRDMSQDAVTDDLGRIVAGNKSPDAYDAAQRGITPATNTSKTLSKTLTSTPYEGGYGKALATVRKMAEKYAKGSRPTGEPLGIEKAAERTVDLADILLKRHYDEAGKESGSKSIAAALSAGTKAQHVRAVAGLITWARYGYTNQANTVQAAADVFGSRAAPLFERAYKAAVQEGLIEKNDAKAQEVKAQLDNAVLSNSNGFDAVAANLRELMKSKLDKEGIIRLTKEVQRIVKTGMRGENVTKGGNTKSPQGVPFVSPRSATDRDLLKLFFGTDEHIMAAMHPFIVAEENARIGKQDDADPVTATSAALEDGEQIDDRESEDVRSATKRNAAMHELPSSTEQHFDEDGNFFDTATPEGKAAFRKLKAAKEGADKEARVEGKAIGIVDHAIQQATEENGGKELSDAKRFKLLQELVHTYYPELEKIARLPKNANNLTRADHAKRKAAYEKEVETKARRLNERFVALEVTSTKAEAPAFQFTKKDVAALRLKRDLRDPKNGILRGTILLQRKDSNGRALKSPYITSAPKLLSAMFARQSEEGFMHIGKGEFASASAHTLQSLLMDGINSLINADPDFSGRVGYVGTNGEPVWLSLNKPNGKRSAEDAQAMDFPDRMLIINGRKEGNRTIPPRTYADAKDAHSLQHAISDKVFDGDPADFGQRLKKVGPIGQMWRMLRNDELQDDADAEGLEKFLNAVKDGKITNKDQLFSLIGRWADHLDMTLISPREMLKRMYGKMKAGAIGDGRALHDAKRMLQKTYGMDAEALKPLTDEIKEIAIASGISITTKTVELRDGDGKQETGRHGNDMLSDADPEHFAPRDDRGLIKTNNLTMAAQSVVGRKVDPSNAATIKADPERKDTRQRAQDVAWDFPTFPDKAPKEDDEALRMVSNQRKGNTLSEQELVTEAIQTMPLVRAMIRAGYVDHIAIDDNLTANKLGYMKTFTPENGTKKQVVVLSPRLFGDKAHKRQSTIAHEVAHTLEGVVGLGQFKKFGRMAILARKVDPNSLFGKMLKMPLQEGSFNRESTSFAQELHAQLFAAYVHPEIRPRLKQHQELYHRLEKLYGNQAKLLRHLSRGGRSADADAARRNEAPGRGAGLDDLVSDPVRGDVRVDSQPAGQSVSGQQASREKYAQRLRGLKPANEAHRRAINNLIAIVEGREEGDLTKAQLDLVRWDGKLGPFSAVDREMLEGLANPAAEPMAEELPGHIRNADEEEYGFIPEYDPEFIADDSTSYESFLSQQEAQEAPEQSSQAGQLQAYLDANKGKNHAWERAASKAIAEGNEKQIVGALAAAKRQFGEIEQSATPAAQQVSQPARSSGEKGSFENPHSLPMSYVVHNIDNIRPELRNKYRAGDGIAKLIANGDRTATTRTPPAGVKVGDYVSFPRVPGVYRITGFDKIDLKSQAGIEAWSKKEGWDTSMIDAFGKQVSHGATQMSFERADADYGDTKKFSKQNTSTDAQATPEQMKKVEAELHRILGDDVKILFEDLADKSGDWSKDSTGAVIRIAVNSDVMGTGFHEAVHQLFSLLRQHGDKTSIDALTRVATGPLMQGRLRKMLKDHPEAIKQLSDPEEAVAYMFQFWMMDSSGFKLGPEAKTLFQKIKGFLDKALALVSRTVRERLMGEERAQREAGMAEYLMASLASGKMADPAQRAAVVDALNADGEKQQAALDNLGKAYTNVITGIGKYFATSEGLLESYNIPSLTKIARMMHQRAGEAMSDKPGFLEAVRIWSNHYEAKVNNILAGVSPEDMELARSWLVQNPEKAHPSPEVNKVVQQVKSYLGEMRDYIEKMGIHRLEDKEWVPIDFRKHYFPHVWDGDMVSKNVEQFLEDLTTRHKRELESMSKEAGIPVEEVATMIAQRVIAPNAQPDLEETTSDLGMTPAATAINRRTLDWLDMKVFDKYMSKDLGKILHTYTHNIIKRGEYQSRFGFGGEKLQSMVDEAYGELLAGKELTAKAKKNLRYYQGQWKKRGQEGARTDLPFTETMPTLRWAINYLYRAEAENRDTVESEISSTLKKLEPAVKTIMGMEGTLGADINPTWRKVQNWITTYQNFRVLGPGLFSSFMDAMGVVREGGEFNDAWGAFVAGIKEAVNVMRSKRDDSYMMQRAELFGSADAGSFSSAVGQHSQSVYMSGKAKEWSDKLFKYNGMEGWNRGVRAYATTVAERIILDWAKNGINTDDKAEVARVERLFGKGFDVKNIKLDADGNVDVNDLKNIAAVNRWVHDAVIAPNAAHRPYLMNDPHFQIFAHLKSFTYSAHAVMLKQVVAQARLGNYRPALVSMLAYTPIAIAAGAIKELLIPGDEPPWMKGGLAGYLRYGWERAGVLGVPQMYAQNLYDSDPVAAFGPTANQLQDLLTVPFGEFQLDVPLTDMKLGWRDHRTFEEMMGAAPFGSVLRRYGKNVDDWVAK